MSNTQIPYYERGYTPKDLEGKTMADLLEVVEAYPQVFPFQFISEVRNHPSDNLESKVPEGEILPDHILHNGICVLLSWDRLKNRYPDFTDLTGEETVRIASEVSSREDALTGYSRIFRFQGINYMVVWSPMKMPEKNKKICDGWNVYTFDVDLDLTHRSRWFSGTFGIELDNPTFISSMWTPIHPTESNAPLFRKLVLSAIRAELPTLSLSYPGFEALEQMMNRLDAQLGETRENE